VLTVYSIDGPTRNSGDMTPEQERGEMLFGYPLLGSVEVTDPEQRRAVVSALKDGAKYRGREPKCYQPRHVVRAVKHEKEVYAIICFECSNYRMGRDGQETGYTKQMAPDKRPVLDEILRAAGVPIAPARLP
jgi:hypothetical protein